MKSTVLKLGILATTVFFVMGCTKTPSVCFTVDKGKSAKVNEEVQFEGSCSQNATTYTWDFGDGSSAVGVSVKHKYQFIGYYTVSLKASNKKKSATLTETISITN